MIALLTREDTSPSSAIHIVEQRLVGVHGVRIVESGTLQANERDHAEGTPYVVIAALSVQSTDFAELALAEIARISAETWARGWSREDGELTLVIFPALD